VEFITAQPMAVAVAQAESRAAAPTWAKPGALVGVPD
jgi:hypothetical protein